MSGPAAPPGGPSPGADDSPGPDQTAAPDRTNDDQSAAPDRPAADQTAAPRRTNEDRAAPDRTTDAQTGARDLPGEAAETANIQGHVNGEVVVLQRSGARFSGHALIPAAEHQRFHSVWRGSYGSIVTAVVRLEDGRTAGAFAVTGGIK